MIVHLNHLFTSPGHNYYEHHGKPAGRHETIEEDSLVLVAGRGIEGDRFFDWKEAYKGQITFLDLAVIEEVREFSEKASLSAGAFRRNVVISGVELNSLIGNCFMLGGIRFEAVEECRPCHWMDEACGKSGTEDLMKGRGGLRCRILDDGVLHHGDAELELDS
jgi:MOSC domain-containing protein YiiM